MGLTAKQYGNEKLFFERSILYENLQTLFYQN